MNTDVPFGDTTAVAPDIVEEFKKYLKDQKEGMVQEDLSLILLPNSHKSLMVSWDIIDFTTMLTD